MSNLTRGTVMILVVSWVTACAARPAGSGAPDYDPNVLTRQEIADVQAIDLYEVVRRLRPLWLSVRGGARSIGLDSEVVVYQGQTLLGGVNELREYGPEMAHELQYLDGPTASASLPGLGSRHVVGAIIIVPSPDR